MTRNNPRHLKQGQATVGILARTTTIYPGEQWAACVEAEIRVEALSSFDSQRETRPHGAKLWHKGRFVVRLIAYCVLLSGWVVHYIDFGISVSWCDVWLVEWVTGSEFTSILSIYSSKASEINWYILGGVFMFIVQEDAKTTTWLTKQTMIIKVICV